MKELQSSLHKAEAETKELAKQLTDAKAKVGCKLHEEFFNPLWGPHLATKYR
jgi:hypothetical protein